MAKGKNKKPEEEQGKEDVGKKEDEKSQEVEEGKEDTKAGEVKKDEGKYEEKGKIKAENGEEVKKPGEKPPPPPPEEVVLKVLMHCEGCAKKVRRCLKGLEGVEDIKTDCKTNTVVLKGKKAAQDPKKVAETIYRKSRKRVEILSPAPAPLLPKNIVLVEAPAEKKEGNAEEKKMVQPQGMLVLAVIKVYMHCESCAEEIKKKILKLSGVQGVEINLGVSQVTVKGNFDPENLVKYIYKRTGKHAVIIKQEQISAGADGKPVDNSKPEKEKEKESEIKEEKTEGKQKEEINDESSSSVPTVITLVGPDDGGSKGKGDNHNYYFFPMYPTEFPYPYPHPYLYPSPPPQIFSDENPNACVVM